jgi:hypothetical protein
MSAELLKLELISWISSLNENSMLEKVALLKEGFKSRESKPGWRNFDDGKGIFTYAAEDFNEPLEDFKEYME